MKQNFVEHDKEFEFNEPKLGQILKTNQKV